MSWRNVDDAKKAQERAQQLLERKGLSRARRVVGFALKPFTQGRGEEPPQERLEGDDNKVPLIAAKYGLEKKEVVQMIAAGKAPDILARYFLPRLKNERTYDVTKEVWNWILDLYGVGAINGGMKEELREVWTSAVEAHMASAPRGDENQDLRNLLRRVQKVDEG